MPGLGERGIEVGAGIDLFGCEYLGGCPTIGAKVLGKVELHFGASGLQVAIAPQGLFTLASAHPVLALAWDEISAVSLSAADPRPAARASRRAARTAVKVLTMRLGLPYAVAIATREWTMDIGVRVAPAELAPQLQQLLRDQPGPTPTVRSD